jgi:hypothetical protein
MDILAHCILQGCKMSGSWLFFFLVDQGLNSGLCTCKASVLLLEPHLQSILLWLFGRWGLKKYLPRLALNSNPPDLRLSSTQDYRCEPLVPGFFFFSTGDWTQPLCLPLETHPSPGLLFLTGSQAFTQIGLRPPFSFLSISWVAGITDVHTTPTELFLGRG